jgi:hypothetical protein
MIKVRTNQGHDTNITVETLTIHSGAMVTLVITDQSDEQQIMVYDDEIDNLIAALMELKGELK